MKNMDKDEPMTDEEVAMTVNEIYQWHKFTGILYEAGVKLYCGYKDKNQKEFMLLSFLEYVTNNMEERVVRIQKAEGIN